MILFSFTVSHFEYVEKAVHQGRQLLEMRRALLRRYCREKHDVSAAVHGLAELEVLLHQRVVQAQRRGD